jgi:predicted ATPase/class 3 adenylate cyclase
LAPTSATWFKATRNVSHTPTYLFTDIEGSTRLWEANRKLMSATLVEHDRIVVEAIRASGGRVVKQRGEGDSIFAVFPIPSAALQAASDLQQALWHHGWPVDCPIRVRIGIHTGESESRDDDFYGPAINLCSRLRDAGHGGQILLTRATRDIIGDALPPGSSITSLGLHRLKDLRRPELIFQLTPFGVPGTFPRLETLDVVPNNLPVQISQFIGRDVEVAEVVNLVQLSRVLTLCGPGGVGKSRIAAQVAAQVVELFEDGVWWVDLDGISESDLVANMIARSLGITAADGGQVIDALAESMTSSHTLLILDGCEQVIAECARVTRVLGHRCRHVTMLATSREPLQILGERVWAVPPMSLPPDEVRSADVIRQSDAVLLFLDRMTLVRAGTRLGPPDLVTVGQICGRLDGIPLAIELAAARTQSMTLKDILIHLDDRLSLLTSGNRAAPIPRQTLRATIDVSYSLLNPVEQQLFGRLSAFAGGFSLEAVKAVCWWDGQHAVDLIDTLSQLVLKSLVIREDTEDEGGRYRLLDTLRAYAVEVAERGGDTALLAGRHAAYYAAFADGQGRDLAGPMHEIALRRLSMDQANLRAAMRWALDRSDVDVASRLALDLWRYWYMTGQLKEGRATYESVLSLPVQSLAPAQRVRLLHGAGSFAYAEGDAQAAAALYGQMLAIAQQTDDRPGIARALNNMGLVAHHRGDYAMAETYYLQSRQLKIELGDTDGEAGATRNLALIAQARADFVTARALCESSLQLWREVGDPRSIAIALSDLANIRQDQGDYGMARSLYDESLALSRDIGDQRGVAWCMALLGTLLREMGQRGPAVDSLNDSLALSRRLGDRRCEAMGLECLAAISLDQHEPAQARTMLEESLRIRTAIRDHRGRCHALLGLARLHLQQGDVDVAAGYCHRSLDLLRVIEDEVNVCRSLELLAATEALRGGLEASRRRLRTLTGWRRARGFPRPPSEQAMLISRLTPAIGDAAAAAWLGDVDPDPPSMHALLEQSLAAGP